ncbi:MAG: LysM peptidoglycan-binding domain-containing protein [Pseudomonadota bacterium]
MDQATALSADTATSAPVGAGQTPDATPASTAPVPQVTPTPPEEAALPVPRFDVVRVDKGGAALVAGAATANAQIILRLDGEAVATVFADGTGNFVSLFDVPPLDTPRVLTVETVDSAGVVTRAEESIIVAPTFPAAPDEGTPPQIATAAVDPARTPAAIDKEGAVAAEASVRADTVLGIPQAPETADGEAPKLANVDRGAPDTSPPSAPRLFRAGPSGVTALDTASTTQPQATQTLGIDAISYDAEGEVQLSGTGAIDQEVRVYLDNRPIQSVRVNTDGQWALGLPNVDTGVYTLRIDAVSADGTVTSRLETPFKRSAPDLAAQLRAEGVNVITVQPGFTLWAISEGYFGDGIQYVQIFEANRTLIRDPDLIYPGQVFALPEDTVAE